jgi:hypothetical protein
MARIYIVKIQVAKNSNVASSVKEADVLLGANLKKFTIGLNQIAWGIL